MNVIPVLTDSGLKNVIIDGDQPTPADMARIREEFQYVPQPQMSDMGGTQTTPMVLQPISQPQTPPSPEPPELKPDPLTPEEREVAREKGIRRAQDEQAYEKGVGVKSPIPDYLKARFQEKGPSALETAMGKGLGRSIAGVEATTHAVMGDEERAKQIDKRLSEIPYEPGMAGLAEVLFQFSSSALPGGALARSAGMGPVATTAVGSASAGGLGFSGQQERLSDMVERYPQLSNPISRYLQSDPDDTFAEGRLKNAVEFAGADAAIAKTFGAALRAFRGKADAQGSNVSAEVAEKIAKDTPRANPNKVIRPPVNGKVAVAHAGAIELPDPVLKAVTKPFAAFIKGVNKAMQWPVSPVSDKIIRPLASRVEEISPRMANRLTNFELEQNLLSGEYMNRAVPFLKSLGKLRKISKADAEAFSRHAMNGKLPEAHDVLRKYKDKIPGMNREFQELRKTFDDLYLLGDKNAVEIPYLAGYVPRIMKDHDGFLKSLGKEAKDPIIDAIELARREKWQRLTDEATKNNTPLSRNLELTDFERREVIRKYLEGSKYASDGKAGFQKKRAVEEILPEHMKFYGSFEENVQNYINNITYRVAKNRFTGKVSGVDGYTDELARLRDKKSINTEQAQELNDLIGARLDGGEKSVAQGWQIYRDAMYLTSIGNPISSITQASEFMLNAFRNGTFEALQAIPKTFRGAGIRVKDLGLDDIAKEFADPLSQSQANKTGAFQKKLNNTLRWTLGKVGFKRMDEVMKEHNLNSAFAQARKQVANKNSKSYRDFIAEQSKFFEGETQSMVDAIRRGDASDPNVKVFLFSKLARTQPISLSQYSEFYLQNPNFRPFFFLKSFGLKQLETTRRQVTRKIASGNPKEIREGMRQAVRLSVLFGGGITGVNTFKDFILDRDVSLWENAGDALLTLFGLSRYSGRKLIDPDKRVEGITDLLVPPKSTEIVSGDVFTNEKNIPLVGKLYSEWFGSARKYKDKRRREEARKAMRVRDEMQRSRPWPSLPGRK
tara:strand:- start:1991 stop:5014 length:3024 start_codon:yes stop_codon:yes gene_type:complete